MASSTNPPVIRDAALRLFAERGPDATVRDIAAAAGVSPALVIRHFGSKEGLRAVVDGHVADQLADALAPITEHPEAAADPEAAPDLAAAMTATGLPASPVPRYLARCAGDDSDASAALLDRVAEASGVAWQAMVDSGTADPGDDPAARAAVLAAIDLAALTLRGPLTRVLGADPLTGDGARRWTKAVAELLAHGYSASPDHPSRKDSA